jgi:DHA1 family bicyclomycin/chloramphenicol resistance-like MFS transporter
MAKLMSFVMLIFTLVPAFAPSLGALIAAMAGWRGIFAAFVLFSTIGGGWLLLRQRETLPPSRRRAFRPGLLWHGIGEIFSDRQVVLSMIVQSLAFGVLFTMLVSTQPVFDRIFGRGESFPLWFGGIALVSGSASLLNAALVERLGMRFLGTVTLAAQVVLSGSVALVVGAGLLEGTALFALFIFWTTSVFFQAGLTIGNLNSLAMEPMGHLAGLTASIVGSVATVAAVVLAAPIGLAFDGTIRPLAFGIFGLSILASLVMRALPDRPTPPVEACKAI